MTSTPTPHTPYTLHRLYCDSPKSVWIIFPTPHLRDLYLRHHRAEYTYSCEWLDVNGFGLHLTDPKVTAEDEGDGYIVVRRRGEYIGEVTPVTTPGFVTSEGVWTDPNTFRSYFASAVVEDLDGNREMVELPGSFPAHHLAITAVAEAAA